MGRLGTLIVLDDGDELLEGSGSEPTEDSPLFSRLLKTKTPHESRLSTSESQIRRARQKPVLVLVHGYAAANAYWMLNLDGLSDHFHVYAVELYGCGRSDRVPWRAKTTDEALDLMTAALEKWRQEAGVDKFILCGE